MFAVFLSVVMLIYVYLPALILSDKNINFVFK